MRKKLRRIVASGIFIIYLTCGLGAIEAKADTVTGTPIIADAKVSLLQMITWARSNKATDTFLSLAQIYWNMSRTHGGVNPEVAYAQAAKETAFGRFGGVLDENFKNPCGLKTTSGGDNSDPNAHQRFNSWEDGVSAHLDHLALYAGAAGYPRADTKDPRHFASIYGKAPTVEELGGKWAPSTTYGNDIVAMVEKIESTVPDQKLAIRGWLEAPADGQVSKDTDILVRGWALNPSGVKEVNIYLGNKYIGQAITGILREDVDIAFPGYPGGIKSGFSYVISKETLTEGTYNVTAEVVGFDGTVQRLTKRIIKPSSNLPARSWLEQPSEGEKYYSGFDITGWALNVKGIKEVNVYINNVFMGKAITGITRGDVDLVFPGYVDGIKSGFSYKVLPTNLKAGKNVIKLDIVGNNGVRQTYTRNIVYDLSRPMRNNLEAPLNNSVVTTDVSEVFGWALNPSGIKEVKVYLDGSYAGNAQTGIIREDVNRVFPGYKMGRESGFSYKLSLTMLQGGNHIITVDMIGNDGTKQTVTRTIKYVPKPSRMWIETPAQNSTITSREIKIAGWALNSSGIKEVRVYCNNSLMGYAKTGILREDVNIAFPGYSEGINSGFEYTLDTSAIGSGVKTIKVTVEGKNGTISEQTENITVCRTIVIDPGHNYGGDDGAYATVNGVQYIERELNMQLAIKLKSKLETLGYTVILTREPLDFSKDDEATSLSKRVNIANSSNALMFISLHSNTFSSSTANGVEVYYSSSRTNGTNSMSTVADSKEIATNVSAAIAAVGFYNRGAKDYGFYVIKNTTMPSILVESGFISSPVDAPKLADTVTQQKIADAIANVVYNKFK